MRLVIATPLYPPEIGGPATYAQLLCEHLPENGIEVELVKFSDVRHLPKVFRHIAYYRHVVRAARKADAVLALDPVSVGLPAMLAARRAKKKFVVKIVGDYAWEQGRQRFGITADLDAFVKTSDVPLQVRLLRQIQTRVAKAATRVIVPSEYLKNILLAWGISESKINVVHNGIDLPTTVQPSERPDGFLIVSSGRRVPWKGFEGIERVVAQEPTWKFFLAEGLAREEALGWVKGADVFVLNSTYEGLSHALIEAMMLGTPVVATRVGGNAELVEDGVTGLLVPSGDDAALRAALKKVQSDPATARSHAVAAQERMQNFSVNAMIAKTVALLQGI